MASSLQPNSWKLYPTLPSMSATANKQLPIASALQTLAPQQNTPSAKSSYNRYFYQILTEITAAREINYVTSPNDTWMGAFLFNGQCKPIVGFDIGLNSSAAKACCDDKSMTSFIMHTNQILHVEHELLMGNTEERKKNILPLISNYWKHNALDIVIKPRSGTCGIGVTRIRTNEDVELACEKMSQKNADICLSPFYEIKHEYRLIMLDYKPEFVFVKERPFVVGNDKDSVGKLMQAQKPGLSEEDVDPNLLSIVPVEGKKIDLTWKHNLCFGAKAILIEENTAQSKLIELAIKAAKAVDGLFVSIDIIEITDGSLLVLEINNGVMAEFLIEQHGEPIYQKVKCIFEKAIKLLLPNLSH